MITLRPMQLEHTSTIKRVVGPHLITSFQNSIQLTPAQHRRGVLVITNYNRIFTYQIPV